MDCSLLYATTFDMLEQGCMRSKNLLDFNQNVIANLAFDIKKILQEHPLSSDEKNCREYVRKAIVEFYRKNGMNAFVYIDKNKNIEISTAIKDPQNNLSVFFLSKWLENNKKKFKSKISNANENFSQEDFNMILEYAKMCIDFDNNELLFRDVVRNAIKKTFNLNPRDGLFFTKLGVYFKIFDFEFVKLSNEIRHIQKLNSARLLDDGDKLKINALLKKIDLDGLIAQIAEHILDTKINFENITNIEFTKNFLFFIVQELRVHLRKILDGKITSILQTCFAEEKIRSMKNIIFEKVADKLLGMIYKGSQSAKKFISFYNGQIINIDNKEVIIPTILDAKGEQWSLEKIEDTLQQKHQIQSQIDALKEQFNQLNQATLKTEEAINNAQNEISNKNQVLSETDSVYENKKKQLQNLKEENMIQKETISISLGKYFEEKKAILGEIENLTKQIEQSKQEKISHLQEQKTIQQNIEKKIEENQTKFIQYNMLVSALSNAISGVKIER
ncbi:hypothetical protein [Helicobacter sp. 11S03491-1]|uniref:coiled-coil domain-containing protein n=1 Tax=Helicobacter sp. 11S03491-1 TaxID=1476196 RepID=UPI000BA5F6AD|nr:hypothetical protein [Helicobacter sp. 11S03491-1]PAF41453.1 hypothetical protein BKH45_06950 [Helicobacter sp. 11S03491-1]